tara:strand:+ start:2550 stop:2699 length:150 start_codon:yes stop_codon:yes gene_type:complete
LTNASGTPTATAHLGGIQLERAVAAIISLRGAVTALIAGTSGIALGPLR